MTECEERCTKCRVVVLNEEEEREKWREGGERGKG
jgi:ferredoxin